MIKLEVTEHEYELIQLGLMELKNQLALIWINTTDYTKRRALVTIRRIEDLLDCLPEA